MGSVRDPSLFRRAQALVLTETFDPRESFFPLVMGFTGDPATQDLPFEFVRQKIQRLETTLPRASLDDYAAYLPFAGMNFCDAGRKEEVKAFFEPRVKNYSGGPRLLAQALESIDLCIGTKKALEPGIMEFLAKY